jgi:SNF family Na+-dependent transporter
MTTEGGYFVIDIMDAYVSRYTLVIAGMFECLFIGHVVGLHKMNAVVYPWLACTSFQPLRN